jgi:hypothetical protein
MRMKTLRWLGAIGVAFATQACVVREAPPVNAGYYPQARISSGGGVAIPQPYAVSTMPPDPLYEQMTASPGMGHVWIDGSWHWNGYEWVWVSGRWEQDQADHVYVQPYYDYSGDTYIYTPGYWSSRDRLAPRFDRPRSPRRSTVRRLATPAAASSSPSRSLAIHIARCRPDRLGIPGNVGPGNSGPITTPRPSYDPDGGGTYRPGPGRNSGYRRPAPPPPQNRNGASSTICRPAQPFAARCALRRTSRSTQSTWLCV